MDPATQTLREALTTQSSSAQAGMILAALSLVQRHCKEWPLLDHFPFFLETHAPPVLRCAATVALSVDQVSVQWPFFGLASLNPQSGHIVLSPLKHPPNFIDWPLPSAWSFVESLPLAHTPEDLLRLAARALAVKIAAEAAATKRRESLVQSAPCLLSLIVPQDDTLAWELLTEPAFPALQSLTLGRTEATSARLAALAGLPCWHQLRYLDASFFRIQSAVDWVQLWTHADLHFEEIRLNCTETEPALALVRSHLPRLRTLTLSGVVRDPILIALAAANFPVLQAVDLRQTSINPNALQAFLQAPKPGLPALQRLGFGFRSDRREDYCDWNGAVVDWGYERMTPQELETTFLAGSHIKLLP